MRNSTYTYKWKYEMTVLTKDNLALVQIESGPLSSGNKHLIRIIKK